MKKKMNRISTKVFTFQFLTTRKVVIKKKIKMLFLLEHRINQFTIDVFVFFFK